MKGVPRGLKGVASCAIDRVPDILVRMEEETTQSNVPTMAQKRPNSRRTLLVSISAVTVILTLLVVFRKPLETSYHQWRMMANWRATGSGATDSGTPDDASRYHGAYERHRNALVTLGVLERRVFTFTHLQVPSERSRELWQHLQEEFPEHPHLELHGYEKETPDALVVWDAPELMQRWKIIVASKDIPLPQDKKNIRRPRTILDR